MRRHGKWINRLLPRQRQSKLLLHTGSGGVRLVEHLRATGYLSFNLLFRWKILLKFGFGSHRLSECGLNRERRILRRLRYFLPLKHLQLSISNHSSRGQSTLELVDPRLFMIIDPYHILKCALRHPRPLLGLDPLPSCRVLLQVTDLVIDNFLFLELIDVF